MHDLNKVAAKCINEMKNACIPIKDNEIIEINARDIGESFGCCIHDENYRNYIITIHEDLISDKCPAKELKEVIIHELIHTCPRCGIHGKTWRKYAMIMNEKYGYSLLEGKDYDSIFFKEKPIIHRYVCPNCGTRYDSRSEEGDCRCPFCYTWYKEELIIDYF